MILLIKQHNITSNSATQLY